MNAAAEKIEPYDAATIAAWDAWEAGEDAQRAVDLTHIRSAALRAIDSAVQKREDLDAKVDALLTARHDADHAIERCRRACDWAERLSIFYARAAAGDVEPSTLSEAAEAIRSLPG